MAQTTNTPAQTERLTALLDYFSLPRTQKPTANGFYNVELCPFCQKDNQHFGFSSLGYRCFSCGASGSLFNLHEILITSKRPRPIVAPKLRRTRRVAGPPLWRTSASVADATVRLWAASKQNIPMWQDYKGIDRASIAKYRLGYGRLPDAGDWDVARLIVPVFSVTGQLVALHGRTPADYTGPLKKWRMATGSTGLAWGLDHLRKHQVLWICENRVDAMILRQWHPEWDTLGVGGARRLNKDETDAIAAVRPRRIVVIYDNDLAGQATGHLYERLQREHLEKMRKANPHSEPIPRKPAGPQVANDLLMLGLNAVCFVWPPSAPEKADIMSIDRHDTGMIREVSRRL